MAWAHARVPSDISATPSPVNRLGEFSLVNLSEFDPLVPGRDGNEYRGWTLTGRDGHVFGGPFRTRIARRKRQPNGLKMRSFGLLMNSSDKQE
jgi:hypothetical protein